MSKKQHIGMLQGVIFGDWTLQRGPTNDVEKLKEWKKNMEKSIPNNWNDCKIFEIKEVKQNKGKKHLDKSESYLNWDNDDISGSNMKEDE